MATEQAAVDWRHEAWKYAIFSFGTGAVFEIRARSLVTKTRVLAFSGIALPLLVGGIAMSPEGGAPWVGPLVAVTSIIGIVQLLGTAWSLVARWSEDLAYAHESASHNSRISRGFERLAKDPPPDHAVEMRLLLREYEARETQDSKHSITEKEKRLGLRAALRQFQRKCTSCGIVPQDLKPSECTVCGNF